jgi:ATP-binding cassette subfamily C protein
MNGPAMQIQGGALLVAHSLPAYEAIKTLEDELARAQDAPPAAAAGPPPAGAIVLRSVTFLHETGQREADLREAGQGRVAGPGGVLDLNLTIEPHEFLGVRGASGAGKTTLADLIVGLFPPQSGEITVGGAALSGAALARWRETIGYVCQDPLLFHDTIRGNLLWAKPGASDEALWRALGLAGAQDFVEKMAGGLDTLVGDRGMLLSGGERQRLALARALLRTPPVLVLDEATSAVDPVGERAILERLRALEPAPTLVMIAHRLESLALCDRVVVLQEGRLAAPATVFHSPPVPAKAGTPFP